MGARVFLIGLDGATFTVLDPLMERDVMPFLRDFTARGVRAPLRTIMPPLTPPAWTSLVTGLRPGRHGVFDFFQKESADSEYYTLATAQDIHAPTIWSLASEAGRKVVSLNFPLMFPPPEIDGWVVPGGWMPWRQLRLGCHPPGLFEELKQLPSFDPRELSLDMQLEAKAIEGCEADEHANWIRLHARRERRWFDILRHLLAKDEAADLVAVMFDGPDKLQHLCWRFIDSTSRPEHPEPWEQEAIDLCEDYFRELDGMLAQIVELAGPEATVVLASDHGFGPTWDVFYVNRWLEEHGYLAWRDTDAGGGDAGTAPHVGFAQITRHINDLDWSRTVAYAATPSSQGINLVRTPPDGSAGVPPERRAELLDDHPRASVPGTARRPRARPFAGSRRRRRRVDPALGRARPPSRAAERQPPLAGDSARRRPRDQEGNPVRRGLDRGRRSVGAARPRDSGPGQPRRQRPDAAARARSARAAPPELRPCRTGPGRAWRRHCKRLRPRGRGDDRRSSPCPRLRGVS